jgi:MFS family permease
VLASQAIPQVLFMLAGGVIADRFPRYRVMVTAEVSAGISYAAAAALILTGTARVPALMALAVCHGIATAMFSPALTGIVPQVVPQDRLQAANGLLRLSGNASRILGYAIAGALVVAVGPGWALAVDAASFLVSAALLSGLKVPATRAGARPSVLTDLREGWHEFSSRQWIWVIVVQFSLVNAAWSAAMVLGPVVSKRDLGGPAAWSAILAAEAVGMVLGVLLAMRIRPRRPMLVATLAVFPFALPFVLFGIRAPLGFVLAAALVAGCSVDVFGVLWETSLQQNVPAEALSRVSSYDWLGSYLLGPIGMLAAGPAAAAVGPYEALLGCAVLIVCATVAALLAPGVRNLPAR